MKSHSSALRKGFMENQLRSSVNRANMIKSEKEENIIEWTTVFRRNWDIYAELVLGVRLKPFQKKALHLLGISDVFFWRASRGTSKSFITALAAIIKLMLYPNSWVVITATAIDQANKIVEDKIRDELILKLSPYLLYMYEKQWLLITKPSDGYIIKNTLNNSTLKVLSPVESSKGSRSTFTIYDEVAIMKKSAIDDIFDGMLFPRQAAYLSNPIYAKNKRWIEESKAIYLTSSAYQFQWWYRTWKDCVTGYYTDKRTIYNVCASDFFVSIENNLKTWGDYRRAKRGIGDIEFRMNYLNEAVGENADAFFSLESFKTNQVIEQCFTIPTPTDIVVGKDFKNRPKKENEVRIVVADFSWTETKSKSNESDNSFALCISGIWKKDHFEKQVDYAEIIPLASDTDACAMRLKELFWLYDADYLVPDARSGGEAIMKELTKPAVDNAYGSIIPTRGLTVSDKMEYQVADSGKLEFYKTKTEDSNALPCVIPILGVQTLNTTYWRVTKQALERNRVKFLISMSDKQAMLEDNGEYYKLSAGELAEVLAPYGNTDLLIQEAINLKTEIKNDQIKLEQPRGGHKDRIVTLAMGLLIFDLIDNAWNKQNQEEDIDYSDLQLVW